MRPKRLLFPLSFLFTLFFLIITIAPATDAQWPDEYFSLSTNKTYLPGEKVRISVFSAHVDSLEFRVYRVKDPVAFFSRLDDIHNFGRISQKEQIDNPTVLERFKDWKHETWLDIRNFFRMQFSWRSRSHIRESESGPAKTKPVSAVTFAQVPLINSSQLVARWRQPLAPRYYSETATIPVDSLQKGAYLVEATNGNLRAYTIVMVTELGLVTKVTRGEVLAFAADRHSGAPLSDTDIHLWSGKKEEAQIKTDASGMAQSKLPEGRYPDVRIIAVRGDDVAVVAPYAYNLSSDPEMDWKGYVYTDRPVYRPGDTAHFKVILRNRSGEQYQVPAGADVQVLVEDSNSKPMLQKNISVSTFGTIHADVTLPVNAALGYYSISVRGAGGQRYQATGGFHVEEYKKPEYEVKVNPATPRVLQGDTIDATIDSRYFFGEPVANADVKYVVHTAMYWSPFIVRDEDENDGEDYEAGGDSDEAYDYAGQEISEQSGKLDGDGKLKIKIPYGHQRASLRRSLSRRGARHRPGQPGNLRSQLRARDLRQFPGRRFHGHLLLPQRRHYPRQCRRQGLRRQARAHSGAGRICATQLHESRSRRNSRTFEGRRDRR